MSVYRLQMPGGTVHGSHLQGNIIFQDISRTFLGQIYNFPGQSTQDLKVINQDMREKSYNISPLASRCLIHLFYLNLTNMGY